MNIKFMLEKEDRAIFNVAKQSVAEFCELCYLNDVEVIRKYLDGRISLFVGSVCDDMVMTITFMPNATVTMSWMEQDSPSQEMIAGITVKAAIGQYKLLTCPIESPELNGEELTQQVIDAEEQKMSMIIQAKLDTEICSKCGSLYECQLALSDIETCNTYNQISTLE